MQSLSKIKLQPLSTKPYVSAIIAAAGTASRMGFDKLFEELNGIPVLVHTILALASSNYIDEIVLVTRCENIPRISELISTYSINKIHAIVSGGNTRQLSVQKGIAALNSQTKYVAIHDGARPFVNSQSLANVVLDAINYGAAALAVPVTDTIKITLNRKIISTPDRSSLYAVQTPQVFELETYLMAVEAATIAGLDFTDDCQLMEFFGKDVYLSDGDYHNFKITTPIDLFLAKALVEQETQCN